MHQKRQSFESQPFHSLRFLPQGKWAPDCRNWVCKTDAASAVPYPLPRGKKSLLSSLYLDFWLRFTSLPTSPLSTYLRLVSWVFVAENSTCCRSNTKLRIAAFVSDLLFRASCVVRYLWKARWNLSHWHSFKSQNTLQDILPPWLSNVG